MSVVVRQLINPQHDLQIPASVGPGSLFLLPALLSMWRDVLGWTGLSVLAGDQSLVGFEKSTAVGKTFFSMPYGGYGGLLESTTGERSDDIFAWLRSRKYIQENIVQFIEPKHREFPREYYRNQLATHIIDLTQKSGGYSENTARNVRKSLEQGLNIMRLDVANQPAFCALLAAHQKRTGELRRLPQKCYEYLLSKSIQPDSGISVWAAANTDGIQCVHIYFANQSDAFYFDGFSSQAGLDAGGNFLLLDHMVADFRSAGIMRLNLGATPPLDRGLQRFKEGWGAQQVGYVEYSRRSQLKRMIDFMTRVR